MPTTYAHWRFGQDCIEKMPENLQAIINDHRDLFDIGVHGPDIFFYDLRHPDVVKYGQNMHVIPGGEFFIRAKKTFKTHSEKEEMLAYIMGFLSHFVLDSQAHGYVVRKDELSPCSHNKIEAEWDRHLMLLDNRKPNLIDRAETLKPNKKNTKIISYFFDYDHKVIRRTCKNQKTVVHMLSCVTELKYNFFQRNLLRFNLSNYADLFFGFKEDQNCRDSNLRLDKIRVKAIKLYPKLMKNLLNYLNDDSELDEYFEEYNFENHQDYKEIPVLTYDKEMYYKI